jgi:hypothetical protein
MNLVENEWLTAFPVLIQHNQVVSALRLSNPGTTTGY